MRWLAILLLCSCAHGSATDRAMSLIRQGKDRDAITLLRERVASAPDDVPARKLLIRVLAMKSEMREAEKEVEALRAHVPPDDPTPDIELGHAHELVHEFEQALESYDHAAERSPSPLGPAEGGMRAAHWGEAEEARPRLEEAIRRGSRDPAIFHALGLVRIKLGDLDGAEKAYRAGLEIDPEALENELGLATVAVVRNDAKSALEAYDAIVKKRPSFAAAELGRAWALAKLGRKDEARASIDRAERLGAPAQSIAKQRAALSEEARP